MQGGSQPIEVVSPVGSEEDIQKRIQRGGAVPLQRQIFFFFSTVFVTRVNASIHAPPPQECRTVYTPSYSISTHKNPFTQNYLECLKAACRLRPPPPLPGSAPETRRNDATLRPSTGVLPPRAHQFHAGRKIFACLWKRQK